MQNQVNSQLHREEIGYRAPTSKQSKQATSLLLSYHYSAYSYKYRKPSDKLSRILGTIPIPNIHKIRASVPVSPS
ncbi:hypothetical protein T4C_11986 [Trichinella pseudospiralis]|uniref:Uncharacterized protein n=1 Tax=Trichinella pseudospiralis TaxID=6337 RepID=A0A0V1KCN1_TRIPS|nr:hypothetical protein T4C_11986 [Trichinella pseudospiralis]